MSAGMQEAAGSRQPACVLCGRADKNRDILGRKYQMHGICFHGFCVVFANSLCQHAEDNRTSTFSTLDLIRTVQQAEQTICFVCGQRGASITCAETGCNRSFHLPCASQGECVTQYFEEFRSFCWEHRPQQAVEAVPAQDTTCIICMDPVGDSRSFSTMVCPSCQSAWFHRACIQGQARSAGIYCFQCPLCRDRDRLIPGLLILGIRVPDRKPRWETNSAYASLGVRHRQCDASDCHYPRGREEAEEEGPWELLLCSSCAAQGTHRCCSGLSQSTATWECNGCAGEGTASSTNWELAGSSTTSQQGLGPSQGSVVPESSSSSTTSQAPSGTAHSSRVPESSGLPSQHRTDQRRKPSRWHRDVNTCSQPRGRRGSCRNAAPSAESNALDFASQGTSGSSRHSPALGYNLRSRQGERARTRSRSPLQCRAPDSPSRPRRRHVSRHTPAPSAESCTHSYTRQGAPGSSRDSTAADGSRSRQPGRARSQSRSPLERVQESQSQPRRRRGSPSRR
ncbi:PHD finger protein 7-like [Numida meleagris]|uniref:PHD finger protein 7-like n=1 Tax=Numida meleagris TaxID=8996 RepID=UPI000B3DA829|nr:PHD finger protein 7-like [Numida meleagris]